MKQRDWPSEWTALVGQAVRRRRDGLGLSAAKLAQRCADLGYEVPRNSIANLENGRKESLPVHELVVLAMALDIAPVDLLFPLGESETMDIRPGMDRTVFEAASWFVGDWPLIEKGIGLRESGSSGGSADPEWRLRKPLTKWSSLFLKWQSHQWSLDRWAAARHQLNEHLAKFKDAEEMSPEDERYAEELVKFGAIAGKRVRHLRELYAENGDPLPRLYGDTRKVESYQFDLLESDAGLEDWTAGDHE